MDKKLFDLYDRSNIANGHCINGTGLSSEEKEKLNNFKKVSHEMKYLSDVAVDEKYFVNVLPKFRERQNKQKGLFSFRKLVFSSSFAYAAVIILIVLFRTSQINVETFTNPAISPTDKSYSVISHDSYIAPSDEYSNEIVDDTTIQSTLDKTIYATLAGSNGNGTDYTIIKSDTDYDKVLPQLDDAEFENLYAQLQQTKIL
ncbi:MAG: hypothetical protein Q8S01_01610 [Ignavibacteria bacterium]|nr:hypothetical protein [Ignavibacteria bacterium]